MNTPTLTMTNLLTIGLLAVQTQYEIAFKQAYSWSSTWLPCQLLWLFCQFTDQIQPILVSYTDLNTHLNSTRRWETDRTNKPLITKDLLHHIVTVCTFNFLQRLQLTGTDYLHSTILYLLTTGTYYLHSTILCLLSTGT